MFGAALGGLASGGAYALIGVCLVLTYRMVGVLNFAQALLGALGVYVALELVDGGTPYGVAAAAGVLAGAGIAAACGLVLVRWFIDADDATRSTVAIALLVGLLTVGLRVFGDSPREVPTPLDGTVVRLDDTSITTTAVAAVLAALILAAATELVLRRTRAGLRLQALAERPRTAELVGVPVGALTVAVWAAGGAIATVALLVVAPTRPSDLLSLSLLVVPGTAAALVGGLRSVGATALGGLAIGLLEGAITSSESLAPYRSVLPFGVILAALLWSQREARWDVAR